MRIVGLGTGLGTTTAVLDSATVNIIANTIQRVEGYFPGSLAYRNNNPGNLIYVGQAGAIPGDGGFARFASYNDGWQALLDQIQRYASRGMTIQSMMNVYAPAGDGDNNPNAYAREIAGALGVTVDTPLQALGMPSPVDSSAWSMPVGTEVYGETTETLDPQKALMAAGIGLLAIVLLGRG